MALYGDTAYAVSVHAPAPGGQRGLTASLKGQEEEEPWSLPSVGTLL